MGMGLTPGPLHDQRALGRDIWRARGSEGDTVSGEEWRTMVGWEGRYEVSNQGRVRSLFRPKRPGQGGRDCPAMIRRLQLNRYGYPVVFLNGNGKPVLKSVHRAVVEAFIGPIPNGMVVNHRDGLKTNNHISNLEICTCKQNSRHMVNVLGKMVGNNHPRSIITEDNAREIVQLSRAGVDQESIAAKFGVTRHTVAKIMTGRQWSRATGLLPLSASQPASSSQHSAQTAAPVTPGHRS